MDKDLKKPLVSVILPAYNAGKYIYKSIASVLNQSYKNFELIIIDDASIDNTLGEITKFADPRIKVIKNDNNLKLPKTLNKGIEASNSKYIARIDADDEWLDKDKIKKQLEFLEDNPSYALVGTGIIRYIEKNKKKIKVTPPLSDKDIRNKMLRANHFFHSTVMFRKKDFLIINGYSEKHESRFTEDWDLWLRLGMIGKMKNLKNLYQKYLVSNDSISSRNRISQYKQNITLIKKYKNNYPNFKKYLLLNYLKLLIYGYLNMSFIATLSLKNRR